MAALQQATLLQVQVDVNVSKLWAELTRRCSTTSERSWATSKLPRAAISVLILEVQLVNQSLLGAGVYSSVLIVSRSILLVSYHMILSLRFRVLIVFIALGALRKLGHVPGVLSVTDKVTLLPYQSGSSIIYYRPEVDDLIRKATGLYLETQIVNHQSRQQMTQKERVGRSGLEGHRRIVRCLVIAAAELLWEGYDPSPTEIKDPQTGEITDWQPREGMGSSETYETFRHRFAPTHKLKTFLFADYLIDEFPTRLPYNPASGWMEDPTMLLRKNEHFDNLTERWVADKAFEMLEKLTDWRNADYYHKGYGGYVTNWIQAATQYHIDRMEDHLKTGATVNLEHIPIERREAYGLRRLRKLRAKCGLQNEKSASLRPLPQRPERGGFVSQYSFDEYVHLDQLAAAAEQERADSIKLFNKLVRHTCASCPETSLLFFPMGFEALVEHMRLGHAKRFWTKDDFDTIG